MWIARDKDYRIHCYFYKPYKFNEEGEWLCHSGCIPAAARLKDSLFPEVKWEDKRPTWKRFIRSEWKYYIKLNDD